jgi:type IV secretory pathway VirB4 component
MIIVGVTGSGKSYIAKLFIIRERCYNPSMTVYIIDPLSEFSAVVNYLEGQVISLGAREKGTPVINPFDIKLSVSEDNPVLHRTQKLIALFKILFNPTPHEQAILETLIPKLYEQKGITKERIEAIFSSPTFGDLQEELSAFRDSAESSAEEKVIASKYIRLLEPWVTGAYSMFNHQTNIELTKSLISFDISALGKAMFTPMMAIAMDFIDGKIRANYERKMLVVDEAHRVLHNEIARAMLETTVREARHFNTGVTIISQSAEDFLQYPEGRVIIENSIINVLMRHDKITEQMQNYPGFNFTPEERQVILYAATGAEGYSECLFMCGNTKTPMVVKAFPFEHPVITTQPSELKALSEQAGGAPS